MTSSEIRQSFLDFFREKQHTIVPSSSLLPDAPNLLFTNAGMNQFVPIFLGQAPCPYRPARAADTQKCIRAGGKHNDLEDVGFDTYHHTFFEMLGNWSFGNYFKKEAIEWAWELVVNRWGFPPSRVYATIYSPGPGDPASLDREAHEHWSEIFIQARLDPAYHVVHGNKKDNFWMMGDTGPCGPCSELHINLTPGPRDLDIPRQIAGRNLVNQGDARCIEIWNLVFIQFNANPDGTFTDLPAKHVDTGMGFERVTSMIQGTKNFTDFENAKISNYETDVFRPLFDELEKITGRKYHSTLPASRNNLTRIEESDVVFRVIADHLRTLCFSIADGILPSNEGRGYVLRRILRRAISYGNRIGLEDDFLVKLVPALSKMFEGVFPELKTQQDIIVKVLTGESKSFGATLSGGNALFEMSVVAGKDRDRSLEIAEKLQELAASWAGSESDYLSHTKEDRSELRMLTIALSGTNIMRNLGKAGVTAQGRANQLALLEMGQPLGEIVAAGEQHRLARAKLLLRETIEALKDVPASGRQISGQVAFLLHDTFGFPLDLTQLMAQRINMDVDVAGFDRLMDEQKARAKAAQKKQIIRIGDSGVAAVEPTEFIGYEHYTRRILAEIRGLNSSPKEASVAVDKTPFYAEMGGQVSDTGTLIFKQQLYKVTNVTKVANVFIHALDRPLKDGAPYTELAGQEVELHVNFVHRAKIEAHHSGTHLMHWALRKVLGTTVSQKGSYVGPDRLRFDFSHGTAMTPEEIAEVERLVNEQIAADVPVAWDERPYAQVKGDPSILQFFGDKYGETVRVVSIGDFSKELCGGTHVRHTQQVGYFKILHESAIAAGIRRIEAMSGEALRVHLKELIAKQVIDGAGTTSVGIEVSTPELWSLYKSREKQLHDLELARIQNEKDAAKKQESEFQKRAATEAPELIAAAKDIHGVPFLAKQIDAPAAYLPLLADALKARWQGVAVLAVADAATGKAALLAAVAPAFTKKVQAGKIIQAIAPLVGGKGGGRPELAQGGGTNPAGIPDALAKAEELLRAA